jgi:hypothetical protein
VRSRPRCQRSLHNRTDPRAFFDHAVATLILRVTNKAVPVAVVRLTNAYNGRSVTHVLLKGLPAEIIWPAIATFGSCDALGKRLRLWRRKPPAHRRELVAIGIPHVSSIKVSGIMQPQSRRSVTCAAVGKGR